MIEAHTDRQLRTVSLLQGEQFHFVPPHRLHRIRQHQHLEPAREGILQHRYEMRVHEGFAAGEADFSRAPAVAFDLIEIARRVVCAQVDQRIVRRAALDIAGRAGEVAQRPGA